MKLTAITDFLYKTLKKEEEWMTFNQKQSQKKDISVGDRKQLFDAQIALMCWASENKPSMDYISTPFLFLLTFLSSLVIPMQLSKSKSDFPIHRKPLLPVHFPPQYRPLTPNLSTLIEVRSPTPPVLWRPFSCCTFFYGIIPYITFLSRNFEFLENWAALCHIALYPRSLTQYIL